jgi:hemerythrin-like domain-containing protein
MQSFFFQITKTLHDEHMHATSVLERMELLFNQFNRDEKPDYTSPDVSKLLGDVSALIDVDLKIHFAFEEDRLFPLLADEGETSMGDLLIDDHKEITPIGLSLGEATKTARANGFTFESWDNYRKLGSEFVERLLSHIEKEEVGLGPMLEDLLDEEQDRELSMEYAGLH